jgi:hypothetical protein
VTPQPTFAAWPSPSCSPSSICGRFVREADPLNNTRGRQDCFPARAKVCPLLPSLLVRTRSRRREVRERLPLTRASIEEQEPTPFHATKQPGGGIGHGVGTVLLRANEQRFDAIEWRRGALPSGQVLRSRGRTKPTSSAPPRSRSRQLALGNTSVATAAVGNLASSRRRSRPGRARSSASWAIAGL